MITSGRVKEVTPLQLLGSAALSYKDQKKAMQVGGDGGCEEFLCLKQCDDEVC